MIQGIDVSSIQGHVDWPAVRAAGIEFAWCRAIVPVRDKSGAWHIARDSRIRENLDNARAAGIHVGAYAFFSPALDPVQQADEFCDVIDVRGGDLRPAIDFEVLHGIPMFAAVAKAIQFVERVEERLGVPCVVYTMSGLSGFWPPSIDAGLLAQRPCWIAHYAYSPTTGEHFNLKEPSVPSQWGHASVWQYAGNKGPRVPGIATDVDRNCADDLAPLLVADEDAPTWPGRGKPVEVPNATDFVRTLADTEPAPPPETEPAA